MAIYKAEEHDKGILQDFNNEHMEFDSVGEAEAYIRTNYPDWVSGLSAEESFQTWDIYNAKTYKVAKTFNLVSN